MSKTKKLLAITGLSLFSLAGAALLAVATPTQAEAASLGTCPRTDCISGECVFTGARLWCVGEGDCFVVTCS